VAHVCVCECRNEYQYDCVCMREFVCVRMCLCIVFVFLCACAEAAANYNDCKLSGVHLEGSTGAAECNLNLSSACTAAAQNSTLNH